MDRVVNSAQNFPCAKDNFMLSSISVHRKLSPVTTDYIHYTLDISAIEFNKTMIYGLNPIKSLKINCPGLNRDCHKLFLGTGKSFGMNC